MRQFARSGTHKTRTKRAQKLSNEKLNRCISKRFFRETNSIQKLIAHHTPLHRNAYKDSRKITSTMLRAHALFDADAARSYPAFSLKGLCASRFCGQCGESERSAAESKNCSTWLSTERWMARLPT
jgi:hypothetical protein